MKTITISQGSGVDYVAMQDTNMEVIVTKVSEEHVADFSTATSLGVLGDIDDSDVQDAILAKLYSDKDSN